jgi:dTDP-4-dehydrorhamnose 3,5-epimerase
MIFTETKLKGAFIIDVERNEDDRGFFGRSWCKKEFEAHGLNSDFVQSSVSYTRHAKTLRGLHYQVPPFAECKIVRCTSGTVFDVIVDIRPESPTFTEWISVELTGNNFRTIYVPQGFAHGFISLKDHASVHYMASQYYTPDSESGLLFDDPTFNIEWPMQPLHISKKDKMRSLFMDGRIRKTRQQLDYDYHR